MKLLLKGEYVSAGELLHRVRNGKKLIKERGIQDSVGDLKKVVKEAKISAENRWKKKQRFLVAYVEEGYGGLYKAPT